MPPAPRGILRLRMCHGPAASLRKSPPSDSGGSDSPDVPLPSLHGPGRALATGPGGAHGRPRRRCPPSEGGEHSLAAASRKNWAAVAPPDPAGLRGKREPARGAAAVSATGVKPELSRGRV